MKPSYLAALVSLLLTAPVLAQGTSAQRAACAGDAWRLCKADFSGGVEAITACMKRERDKLGAACRTVLNESEAGSQQAASPAKEPAPQQAAEAAPAAAPVPGAPGQQAAAAPVSPVTEQPAKPAPVEAASPAPSPPARPKVAAARKPIERAMVARRAAQQTVASAKRPTRHLAAARSLSDDEVDIREANRWMRQLGLGAVSRETVRDVRRFEAFFDARL